MTTSEVYAQFVIRWNGGPLLPDYEGNGTLTEAARMPKNRARIDSEDPASNPANWHAPKKERKPKYPLAFKQAVQARRQEGATYQRIAEQFGISVHQAYNLATERKW